MRLIVAGLICLALVGVECHSHAESPVRATYIEPVHDFSMRELNIPIREEPISTEDHYAEHQPYADFLQVSFTGFGKTWNYNLIIDKSMWEEGAKLKFYDGSSNEEPHTVITPKHRHYVFASNCTRVDAYFYNFKNMHAMITHEGEIYTIDTVDHLSKIADEWILPKTEMGIYKHAHLVNGVTDPNSMVETYRRRLAQTKLTDVTSEEKFKPPGATPPTRRDNSIAQATTNVWTNCYPGQNVAAPKAIKIGWAITHGYYGRIGGTAQALEIDMAKIISSSNHIYVPQMQVYLTVQDSVVYTAAGGETWNLKNNNNAPGCPGAAQATDHLEQFRLWKEQKHAADAGVWHMMTDCFPPPGTVGIAYVGVLCNARAGAGWSSFGTNAVWKTVAHEVGHNFNADHSFENGQGRTGGIMDYGDGLNPPTTGVYEFNTIFRKTQVCAHIAQSQSLANRNNLANCWGNARLTGGAGGGGKTYAWGDGTALACPVTCVQPGAQAPKRVIPKVCFETTAGTPPKTPAPESMCPPPKPLGAQEPCSPVPPACQTGPTPSPPGMTAPDRQSMFQSVKYTKIYVFNGEDYAAYINQNTQLMVAATPPYPRKIAEWWGKTGGLELEWKKGNFDAIIQKSEGSIYFFKNKKFVVYELGFGLHNEYKATATNTDGGLDMHAEFNKPGGTKVQIPTTWLSIDAAVSIDGGAYIFKGNEYALIRFDCATAADCPRKEANGALTFPRPISDWGGDEATGGLPWPTTWQGRSVDSAVGYWDETGADLYVSGQFVKVKWDQRGIASAPAASQNYFTNPAAGNTPTDTPCQATFCAVCVDGSATLCKVCEGGSNSPDYLLINQKCQPKNFAVELLFEDYQIDKKYLLTTGNVQESAWAAKTIGNTGNGLALTATQYLDLQPPQKLGSNTPLEMVAYEFHFWIKPAVVQEMKMVTMTLSNSANQVMTVAFNLENANTHMLVLFKTTFQDPTLGILETKLQHYEKVSVGRWYHLICTFQNSNMKITDNGNVVRVPLTQQASEAFKKFTIKDAKIGAAQGGIEGIVDQFHVDDLSKSGTTTQVDGNCIDASTVESADGYVTCDFVSRGNTVMCQQSKVKKGCCKTCKGLYDATFNDANALQGTFWLTLGFALVSILFSQ